MTNIKQLIESIRLSGATLELVEGKLLYTSPPGLDPDGKKAVLNALRASKVALIAYLTGPTAGNADNDGAEQLRQSGPCGSKHCAGCYSVELGVNLHPPKGTYHNKESW